MDISSLYYVAAATYNCGAYGAGNFGNNAACSTVPNPPVSGGGSTGGEAGTSTGTNGGATGILADTGYNVLLPVAFGAAVIIAALILLAKRLFRKSAAKAAN